MALLPLCCVGASADLLAAAVVATTSPSSEVRAAVALMVDGVPALYAFLQIGFRLVFVLR